MRHLLLVLLTACGPISDRSDWLPDDVDSNATIAQIGAAGLAKVCSAFDSYVRETYRSNRLVQLACTADALENTADAVACGQAVDACLDMLPPAVESRLDEILAQAGCTTLDIAPSGCAAKVSQLSACLDALGDQIELIQLSLTCAAFGSPVPPDWWMIDPPAACTAIIAGC